MGEAISLQEVIKIIRKRLLLIISLVVISVGISIGISFYLLTPIYQAQTQILVNQQSSLSDAYSWQSIETDLRLINTYNVIITNTAILTPVIEELKLDVTPEELSKQISVSNESDSKVVNISVLDPDPSRAVEISNTISEVFKERVSELMRVDNISILSEAKLSDNPIPVRPNKILNIFIAAVFGLMLGVSIVILLEILDTTIKSEKDIEEHYGLPVIGIVGLIVEKKEKKISLKSRSVRRSEND
ncbi:Wzz/FepE/Etk N-terminal domain-containing protein [Solibacillus sp. MA9]|uniref:Wzz/FepE/Etk N-terminal domain-containing protein n=1 Tax=Solibacillus palustris TaxID=2908203 RepID=A0ABS9UAJ9_9BACL|nr:Wzz/FepE/Etk N-terminal domain-containing protein [Solibacillus sp. MA9]MCH7321040.1 Wzz/FepE/Etk N-terminal domain-containing protein [Solibacillus sp. MA9]